MVVSYAGSSLLRHILDISRAQLFILESSRMEHADFAA